MSLLLSTFASDILPIFLVAGVGFVLARWVGVSARALSHVVFYALLPWFAFRLLTTSAATGRAIGRMVLLATLVMASMIARRCGVFGAQRAMRATPPATANLAR